MVKGRRGFSGTWPLARFPRLAEALAETDGEASFEVQFDRDGTGMSYVEIRVTAVLPLRCQRTLEIYQESVERQVRLGLLEHERDEAALPEGYEPLLVDEEPIRLTDLVEDELILALPLVPRSGEAPADHVEFEREPEEAEPSGPFAGLAALKKNEPS
ncbi:MAG: YceD family protein [Pseudomonadota bacterium]